MPEDATAATLAAIKNVSTEVVWLATIDDKPVGWMQLSHLYRIESGQFCEITGLVVNVEMRKMGIGKQLLVHAKQWTQERDCPKLRVRSNVIRREAHQFYRSQGFNLVKEQKIFELEL